MIVTADGTIYVDANDGHSNTTRVDKWPVNGTGWVTAMSTQGECAGVFVDIYDSIYCSDVLFHQVVRRLSNESVDNITVIAGIGTNGSALNMLSSPRGILVTRSLNLYVADCDNDRVQRFPAGQRQATTVLGGSTPYLNCPTGITMDGFGFLFVTDSGNNRVIGSGRDGYRCIVGCGGTSGSGPNQLNNPRGISFDTDGNIYVVDGNNDRIQKFLLASSSCGKLSRILWKRQLLE